MIPLISQLIFFFDIAEFYVELYSRPALKLPRPDGQWSFQLIALWCHTYSSFVLSCCRSRSRSRSDSPVSPVSLKAEHSLILNFWCMLKQLLSSFVLFHQTPISTAKPWTSRSHWLCVCRSVSNNLPLCKSCFLHLTVLQILFYRWDLIKKEDCWVGVEGRLNASQGVNWSGFVLSLLSWRICIF